MHSTSTNKLIWRNGNIAKLDKGETP